MIWDHNFTVGQLACIFGSQIAMLSKSWFTHYKLWIETELLLMSVIYSVMGGNIIFPNNKIKEFFIVKMSSTRTPLHRSTKFEIFLQKYEKNFTTKIILMHAFVNSNKNSLKIYWVEVEDLRWLSLTELIKNSSFFVSHYQNYGYFSPLKKLYAFIKY